MKIDIFTHVMPKRYKEALYKYADKFATERAVQDRRATLTDKEARLSKFEGYDDLVQVLVRIAVVRLPVRPVLVVSDA